MEAWVEKIKKGMEFIKEGCEEQCEWAQCQRCPFEKYCTALEDAEFETPDLWGEL